MAGPASVTDVTVSLYAGKFLDPKNNTDPVSGLEYPDFPQELPTLNYAIEGYARSPIYSAGAAGQCFVNRAIGGGIQQFAPVLIRLRFTQNSDSSGNTKADPIWEYAPFNYMAFPWADQSYFLPVQPPYLTEGAYFYIDAFCGKTRSCVVSVHIDPNA